MPQPRIPPPRRTPRASHQSLTRNKPRKRNLGIFRYHPIRAQHRPIHHVRRQSSEELEVGGVFEEDRKAGQTKSVSSKPPISGLSSVHSRARKEELTTSKASISSRGKTTRPARPSSKPSKASLSQRGLAHSFDDRAENLWQVTRCPRSQGGDSGCVDECVAFVV